MNRWARHQPDYVLAGIIFLLLAFGLVMLSSAGSVLGFQKFGDSNYFLKKQLLSVVVGLAAMAVTFTVDHRRWEKLAPTLLVVTIILLLLPFMPGIGSLFLGAHRWVHVGPILVQPSEFAKLTFLLYLASWLSKRQHHLTDLRQGLVPFLITVGVVTLLMLAQPDLGTASVIVMFAMVMYFVAGGPMKYIGSLIVAGIAFLGLIIKLAPYRAQRFTVFLNPALDPKGIGYHINQALLAIGSGGWFGLGLGHSRQKFNYLPEPAGDSIFAVMAEELGLISVAVFIATWFVFMYRGMMIARRTSDDYSRYVATGITAWLGFQAFLNIAALCGLLPLTGIPLPLMSHGGSAMIANLAALGILLNISRSTSRPTRV